MEIRATKAEIKAAEHVDAADTTQTVPLFRIPPEAYIIFCGARVTTAFAGVTLPEVSVGESTDVDSYIKKQPINVTGDLKAGAVAKSIGYCESLGVGGMVKTEATRSVQATFTSSSGNLSSLSAGEIEFVIVYIY